MIILLYPNCHKSGFLIEHALDEARSRVKAYIKRNKHDAADAEAIGGDVTVASEPGKGSVFTVRLPSGPTT
jgi:hypothetical protein